MFDETKIKEGTLRLISTIALVIIAIVMLCNCLPKKYDYAVMFSENTIATLQQIKAEKWEIVNARWAADARGVWNYEFVVRKPAPFFAAKKPAAQRPAPRQVAQPAPQQPAPQPAAQPAPQPAPTPAPKPAEQPKPAPKK